MSRRVEEVVLPVRVTAFSLLPNHKAFHSIENLRVDPTGHDEVPITADEIFMLGIVNQPIESKLILVVIRPNETTDNLDAETVLGNVDTHIAEGMLASR